jgi:hypothetical protein
MMIRHAERLVSDPAYSELQKSTISSLLATQSALRSRSRQKCLFAPLEL